MNFKNKNVLVYGLSSSGEWAAKLLIKQKASVFLFDDNVEKLKSKQLKNCYLVQQLNENFISQLDYIVLSPSIEPNNEYVVIAKKLKIKIFSELEFASLFEKNFIAVTGTNGKTTTVQLITAMLNVKHIAIACGNIGYPFSRAVLENKKQIKVVEVSSFMLENASSFHPHIATILNIQPDHLVRHKTMEEYSRLKHNIFKNLTPNDYAVINLDNNIKPKNKTLVVTYSQTRSADVYLKNGAIYLHNNKIININDLKLKGQHNIYNVMCAICFAYILKIKPAEMSMVLKNFVADDFRIQKVSSINGIDFYNDSKSTNIASTLASVQSIKGPIILLLGGSFKQLNYAELFNSLPARVRHIFVYGEIANELEMSNDNKFKLEKCKDLTSAFNNAVNLAIKGDNVLLSPATASYDQFSSYIERGEKFNNLVREYETKTKQG